MRFLELKIPPLILVFVWIGLMWLVAQNTDRMGLGIGFRLVVSLLISSFAFSICLSGLLAFKANQTTVNPVRPETSSRLVDQGIYQYTRNPMYLGFSLFLMACAIYFDSLIALATVPFFIFYMTTFQIKPEEAALLKLFGDSFETYMSKVRRWL
uniref:methyltransferase family protein n=1 Tax=Thaumasiovibrio occultus TaxID=1891184 RepID=UPI000B34BFCB|nr:isoprenylcysteine carboxylmethyltransferase family protein [Thaumasiovibrio occultus]